MLPHLRACNGLQPSTDARATYIELNYLLAFIESHLVRDAFGLPAMQHHAEKCISAVVLLALYWQDCCDWAWRKPEAIRQPCACLCVLNQAIALSGCAKNFASCVMRSGLCLQAAATAGIRQSTAAAS